MTTATWAPSWTNRRGVARQLLAAALELPVTVDRVTTSRLALDQGGGRQRLTTLVEVHGGTHVGRGEDIAYDPEAHEHTDATFTALDVAGDSWTVASLSAHLDSQPLVPKGGAGWDDKPAYHRWAIEGAILDLALRQAGMDLATLAGAPWGELAFAASMGLGTPPSLDAVTGWTLAVPGVTFKVDTGLGWDEEVARGLAGLGAVTTVDFKGLYQGDWADNEPLPALYELVARLLPDALLEDANLTPAVLDALDEHALRRLAWDYPITGPQDVPGLPGSTATFSDLRPGAINIKPSRFGTLERLLATIDLCDREGIPCYSGGQYELGIGRTQVQAIAALCFPDAPNDCAPVQWHGATPGDAVPASPLTVPTHVGFGWE